MKNVTNIESIPTSRAAMPERIGMGCCMLHLSTTSPQTRGGSAIPHSRTTAGVAGEIITAGSVDTAPDGDIAASAVSVPQLHDRKVPTRTTLAPEH
jgi:hypothetical protein